MPTTQAMSHASCFICTLDVKFDLPTKEKGHTQERAHVFSKCGTKSIIEARISRARAQATTSAFPKSGHDIGSSKRTRCRACWLNNVSLRPAYIANIDGVQNTVKQRPRVEKEDYETLCRRCASEPDTVDLPRVRSSHSGRLGSRSVDRSGSSRSNRYRFEP